MMGGTGAESLDEVDTSPPSVAKVVETQPVAQEPPAVKPSPIEENLDETFDDAASDTKEDTKDEEQAAEKPAAEKKEGDKKEDEEQKEADIVIDPHDFFAQGSEEWSTKYCDCCSCTESPMCIPCHVIVPCIPVYMAMRGIMTGQLLGENCCSSLLCGCFGQVYNNGRVAQQRGVKQDVSVKWCIQSICCFYCNVWQMNHELQGDETIKESIKTYSNEWRRGLFGCCADPRQACLVCCCCCYPMGKFYQKLGKSCLLGCCCGCCLLGYTRGRFVSAKKIKEPTYLFGAKTCCCFPCSVCQILGEID